MRCFVNEEHSPLFIACLSLTGVTFIAVLGYGIEDHRKKKSKKSSASTVAFCLPSNNDAKWMIHALYIMHIHVQLELLAMLHYKLHY